MPFSSTSALTRAHVFCERFGLARPVLLAPMAGASPPSLSVAVMQAGGLGACGALLMQPAAIVDWAREVRARGGEAFQINLWVPDPAPVRDAAREAAMREYLCAWGPEVAATAGDTVPLDFEAQFDALLEVAPPIVSSVMGLYPEPFVARLKAKGIAWFANVSTVTEARAAEAAGADAVVAQGMEAGGHRGCFDQASAERDMAGLFALVPAIADAVCIPVVATGGIADARGVAAALTLGASAAQIGTALLRSPESGIHPAWAEALGQALPEDTMVTRAFSGRAGRSIATRYARAMGEDGAPVPAPYPVQRGLTAAMRAQAQEMGDIGRMQAWAGQSAGLGQSRPAGDLVRQVWDGALQLLPTLN